MSFPELEPLKLCMGYGKGDGGRQEGRMGCIQPESERRVSGIGPWDGLLGLEAEG